MKIHSFLKFSYFITVIVALIDLSQIPLAYAVNPVRLVNGARALVQGAAKRPTALRPASSRPSGLSARLCPPTSRLLGCASQFPARALAPYSIGNFSGFPNFRISNFSASYSTTPNPSFPGPGFVAPGFADSFTLNPGPTVSDDKKGSSENPSTPPPPNDSDDSSSKKTLREDYVEGSGIISSFMKFCDEIRRANTPNRVLPHEFEKYLLDSIEKLRQHGMLDEYADILKKDAENLIKQKQLTLYQWNVLYYRAAIFSDLSELDKSGIETVSISSSYRRSYFYDYSARFNFNRKNTQIFESQQKTAQMLEKDLLSLAEDKSIIPRARTSDAFVPLMDGVSCPASVFENNIGIASLSFANSAHVYPIGIAHALFYDGNYTSARELFWSHDFGHASTAMRNLRDKLNLPSIDSRFSYHTLDESGKEAHLPLTVVMDRLNPEEKDKLKTGADQFRKERIGFLDWVTTRLSVSDQEKILLAYFVADHEEGRDIDQLCSKDFKAPFQYYKETSYYDRGRPDIPMSRFHRVTDLNPLLPKNLQGDRDFFDKLAKTPSHNSMEYPQRIKVTPSAQTGEIKIQAFGKEDIVEKWSEISSYVVSAYQLMCDNWKEYKKSEQDQTLVDAAKGADHFQNLIHQLETPGMSCH